MVSYIVLAVISLLLIALLAVAIVAIVLQEGPLVSLLIILCPVAMFAPMFYLQGVFSPDSAWLVPAWVACSVGIPLILILLASYIQEKR